MRLRPAVEETRIGQQHGSDDTDGGNSQPILVQHVEGVLVIETFWGASFPHGSVKALNFVFGRRGSGRRGNK